MEEVEDFSSQLGRFAGLVGESTNQMQQNGAVNRWNERPT